MIGRSCSSANPLSPVGFSAEIPARRIRVGRSAGYGRTTDPDPRLSRWPPRGATLRPLYDLAESLHAAAVVVGSSHRGALGRVLVGNVATQLLSGGPCPVLLAPRGLEDRAPLALWLIGVGFDDSGES